MKFCEGEDAVFEQLMKTVPGFDREPDSDKKDCRYCLHFDHRRQKCALEICPYYGQSGTANS